MLALFPSTRRWIVRGCKNRFMSVFFFCWFFFFVCVCFSCIWPQTSLSVSGCSVQAKWRQRSDIGVWHVFEVLVRCSFYLQRVCKAVKIISVAFSWLHPWLPRDRYIHTSRRGGVPAGGKYNLQRSALWISPHWVPKGVFEGFTCSPGTSERSTNGSSFFSFFFFCIAWHRLYLIWTAS